MSTIKLTNNAVYSIPVSGIREIGDQLYVCVISNDAIETLKTSFSGNTGIIKVYDGETEVAEYSGYTNIGKKILVDEAASVGTDGAETTARTVTFWLEQKGLSEQVTLNRSDIDYLLMMGGNS